MGQANGKKATKKKPKIDYTHPPKLKRASTAIFKTGVKKMGDMRKVLDSEVYNINMQTEKSQSGLLHLAANSDYVGQLSSLALVKELIGRNADLDIANKDGFRPVHIACGLQKSAGNAQVAMALIQAGADPITPSSEGWTPLHYASLQGNRELMKALLLRKADPTQANPEGDTPLHLVLTGDHVEKMSDDKMNKMVVLLLATGAQPNIKDRKHKLALDYALKQFFHKAAMSLLAIGADIVPFAEANTLLDSHEAVRVALRKDEENLLLIDMEPSESESEMSQTVKRAKLARGLSIQEKETVDHHVQAIKATEKWIAQRHCGNRIKILRYLKQHKCNMSEVLACMRINDGFRLILSAIAIGIEEIGFAQQAEEAKTVAIKNAAAAFFPVTKGSRDGASAGADTKQTNIKAVKANKAKELAKAVNRAKQMHSAIPMWLTENLSYFQSFHGQLHAAENQILDHKHAKKVVSERRRNSILPETIADSTSSGKADSNIDIKHAVNSLSHGKDVPISTQKSDGKMIRKAKVDMGLDPEELSDTFDAEDEEISPFKMLREVCQTRQNLQDHAIAAVHLKEGLHDHFKGLTDPKFEFKPARQDDDGLVPRFSKTSNMDETCYGFALVMMGMVLTPPYADTVSSLLKKKFKNKDYTYTIMRAPCKSFSRMFNKIKTDHANVKAPRYAQNVDVVRMGLVFDEPAGLSEAAKVLMKNMEVVRTKNQFVLREGDERGGYKAVILTLRYTDPRNATFGQMCENNKEKWTRYIEDTKDRHKNYARKAMKWLCSKALAKKEVAMACEVQLMYKPYYFYRKNVHFLYKVLRTENLEQFLRDFAPKTDAAIKKNKDTNKRRAKWAQSRNTRHSVRLIGATRKSDMNNDKIFPELSGSHRSMPGVGAAADSVGGDASPSSSPESEKVCLPTI